MSTISYELAKALKDAGFPQQGNPWGREDKAYNPTLSELIEACGSPFFLTKDQDYNAGKWTAVTTIPHEIKLVGNTPEEAVARLWLALNKKNA